MTTHSAHHPSPLVHGLTACLLLLLFAVPNLAATEKSPVETARVYLDHYSSLRFEALGEFLTPETRLADPAQEMEIIGKEEILAALPKGFRGVEIERKNVERLMESLGGYVLTVWTVAGTNEVRQDGETVVQAFDIPVVIILRIVDGKVVEHLDYPDYGCAARQAAVQTSGPLPTSELPRCEAPVALP